MKTANVLPVGKLDFVERVSSLDSCRDLHLHLCISSWDILFRIKKSEVLLNFILSVLDDHLNDRIRHEVMKESELQTRN
jgi:hypothetical protein